MPLTVLAAPLQGYTEAYFRNAHANVIGGIDEYTTPFLRLEKGVVLRSRDIRDILPENNRLPVSLAIQILCKTSSEGRLLIGEIRKRGYRRIDFNFGCPFAKVVREGYGAAMVAAPNRMEEVLSLVSEFPDLVFSVKMRLGVEDVREYQLCMKFLNQTALSRIVLHPRTAAQGYKGIVNSERFETFRKECAHPVFWNGDIVNAGTSLPECDGVMIGRGLLANPFLGHQLKGQQSTGEIVRYHGALLAGLQDDEQCLNKMKIFWEYFLPSADKRLRKKIQKSTTLEEYHAWCRELFQSVSFS